MFEIFKSTLNKVKNNEEKIEKDEVKALSSIVSLLVEAASIDGQIGDDEKNKVITAPSAIISPCAKFTIRVTP